MSNKKILIQVNELFEGQAKLKAIAEYEKMALSKAGLGNDIVLSGPAPIWLYLRLAHALHGIATTLRYQSPVTGEIIIFDHDPN